MKLIKILLLGFFITPCFAMEIQWEYYKPTTEFIYELADAQYGSIPHEPQFVPQFESLHDALDREENKIIEGKPENETNTELNSETEKSNSSYREQKKRKISQKTFKTKNIHNIAICTLCNKQCKSSQLLQDHYEKLHKIVTHFNIPEQPAAENTPAPVCYSLNEGEECVCNKCGKHCKDSALLETHMRRHIQQIQQKEYTDFIEKNILGKFGYKTKQKEINQPQKYIPPAADNQTLVSLISNEERMCIICGKYYEYIKSHRRRYHRLQMQYETNLTNRDYNLRSRKNEEQTLLLTADPEKEFQQSDIIDNNNPIYQQYLADNPHPDIQLYENMPGEYLNFFDTSDDLAKEL